MKITTSYLSDQEYEAQNEKGNKVFIDMKDKDKTGQSPMEIVLSALSACVAVEIATIIKKRKKQLDDLKIEATGTRREENPRSYTSIDLKFILKSPDAKGEELHKATKLSLKKYCSVADSLKADINFTTEVIRQ